MTEDGAIVLRNNEWTRAQIDGVGLDPAGIRGGIRGYKNVASGLHIVVSGNAALAFVLYPREVLVRRLDGDRWVLEDEATEQQYVALASGGMLAPMYASLVDHRMLCGMPQPLTDAELAPIVDAFSQSAARATSAAAAQAELPKLGAHAARMIGRPMVGDQLGKLRSYLDATASSIAAGGALDRALWVTTLALAVLPEEPTLLDLQANLFADLGDRTVASEIIERAHRRRAAVGERLAAKIAESHATITRGS